MHRSVQWNTIFYTHTPPQLTTGRRVFARLRLICRCGRLWKCCVSLSWFLSLEYCCVYATLLVA
ncbi:hypothetical protein Hanom_Chr03g00241431 [Helianthus anomalus]